MVGSWGGRTWVSTAVVVSEVRNLLGVGGIPSQGSTSFPNFVSPEHVVASHPFPPNPCVAGCPVLRGRVISALTSPERLKQTTPSALPNVSSEGFQPGIWAFVFGAAGECFREGGDDALHPRQRVLRLPPQQHRHSAGALLSRMSRRE